MLVHLMAAAHGTYPLLWLRVTRDGVSTARRHSSTDLMKPFTTTRRILLMFSSSKAVSTWSSYFTLASYTPLHSFPVFIFFVVSIAGLKYSRPRRPDGESV